MCLQSKSSANTFRDEPSSFLVLSFWESSWTMLVESFIIQIPISQNATVATKAITRTFLPNVWRIHVFFLVKSGCRGGWGLEGIIVQCIDQCDSDFNLFHCDCHQLPAITHNWSEKRTFSPHDWWLSHGCGQVSRVVWLRPYSRNPTLSPWLSSSFVISCSLCSHVCFWFWSVRHC